MPLQCLHWADVEDRRSAGAGWLPIWLKTHSRLVQHETLSQGNEADNRGRHHYPLWSLHMRTPTDTHSHMYIHSTRAMHTHRLKHRLVSYSGLSMSQTGYWIIRFLQVHPPGSAPTLACIKAVIISPLGHFRLTCPRTVSIT